MDLCLDNYHTKCDTIFLGGIIEPTIICKSEFVNYTIHQRVKVSKNESEVGGVVFSSLHRSQNVISILCGLYLYMYSSAITGCCIYILYSNASNNYISPY